MTLELPPSVREAWCAAGARTTDGRVMIATVTAETTVFEPVTGRVDDELANRTGDEPADGPSIPPRSLLTVDLSFSPPLSSLGVDPAGALGTAAPKASDRVVDVLEDEGIAVGTEEIAEALERADGTTGRRTVHALEYPVSGRTADGGSTAEDGAETIDAELRLCVWPTEASFALAGGIVPLSAPDGGDVRPERDRETVRTVMERTGLEGSQS